MRHGSANRRPRNRNHGGQNNGNRRGTHNRNQIFDSNGPDVRIRGTAHQVCEKYLALAKDAQATGDVIQAENYLQHAEHYQRIINSWGEDTQAQQRQNEAYAPAQEQSQDDDLSLPASILGGEVKLEDERTAGAEERQDMLEAV
jgi:hypothetical protein